MLMLYNSDAYAVLRFDLDPVAGEDTQAAPRIGGFEILDKRGRKEIFLSGLLAEHFRQRAEALSQTQPSPEQWDEFIAGFTELSQQPLVLH